MFVVQVLKEKNKQYFFGGKKALAFIKFISFSSFCRSTRLVLIKMYFNSPVALGVQIISPPLLWGEQKKNCTVIVQAHIMK